MAYIPSVRVRQLIERLSKIGSLVPGRICNAVGDIASRPDWNWDDEDDIILGDLARGKRARTGDGDEDQGYFKDWRRIKGGHREAKSGKWIGMADSKKPR